MLHESDLEAAIAQGIVTADQAAALRTLGEQRERERAIALGHEERFQFLRSFNDFFFAIGVALLGGGLVFFTAPIPLSSLVAAVIAWGLAELLVARMRLVLPGILLVCFFVAFVILAAPVDLWFVASTQTPPGLDAWQEWFTHPRRQLPVQRLDQPLVLVAYALVGVVAALLFYVRFRLPFALLLVAGGLIIAVVGVTHYQWPLVSKPIESLELLLCGIAVFAAAMAFDGSDRERLTRRSDCAFWLHLLAAPLIVHSLIELIWQRSANVGRLAASLTTEAAVGIALIVAVLAVIAIIIDRRALLVSALSYLGVIIGYAIAGTIGRQGADKSFVFFATLVVLGTLVVALGVGWQPIRRVFLALLPAGVVNRLPPVATARARP